MISSPRLEEFTLLLITRDYNTYCGDCDTTWVNIDGDWLVPLCRKNLLDFWSQHYWENTYCGDCDITWGNIDKWVDSEDWWAEWTEDNKSADSEGDTDDSLTGADVWSLPLISWFTIVIKASTDEHLSVITDLLHSYVLVGKAILPLSQWNYNIVSNTYNSLRG